MQISKSRLKEIVKEELIRVNENHQEAEQQQVSVERAYELAVQLEQFIPRSDTKGRKIVGELYGILADLSASESEEV